MLYSAILRPLWMTCSAEGSTRGAHQLSEAHLKPAKGFADPMVLNKRNKGPGAMLEAFTLVLGFLEINKNVECKGPPFDAGNARRFNQRNLHHDPCWLHGFRCVLNVSKMFQSCFSRLDQLIVHSCPKCIPSAQSQFYKACRA